MEWALGGIIALVGILRYIGKLDRRIEALEANAKTNNEMISDLQRRQDKPYGE